MNVTFEMYGVARLRAGRDKVQVSAATLGAALGALETACPVLAGALIENGRLGRHYRLSLNGREFVSDPDRPLAEGDILIVLSAEAGG